MDSKSPSVADFAFDLYKMELPAWDKDCLRPATKMPDCPRCGEDELGMFSENWAICYACSLQIERKEIEPCHTN
jgi:hypothetical protein